MPETTVDLGVLAGSDVEFRAETIYFLVLDRFAEGNPDKGREDDEMFDASRQDWHKYWGGDLQGLIDRLDYLQSFGISAVWTTPLFEQVQAMAIGDMPRAPIHGYWTRDFKRINPRWMNDPSEKRLFTRDDTTFDALLDCMHSREMKFVLDIVCNHSSPATERGKGKLYDDGRLIADFDNDHAQWYHHYGEVTDWTDEWQIQNCELAGLATFNENNVLYRNHIKEAIKLWIGKGVDALRIDTVKHMPLWFWQEFTSDISVANPNVFRFGEWIYNHPDNPVSVEFDNKAGMSLLDFGYCQAVRECFTGAEPGFLLVQKIFDLDGNYNGATELVTFFENHDMPRLQSLDVSDRLLELALVPLITTRGIPCLYYGCEQYLHDDTDGGDDPYNRPMMTAWEPTKATRLIGILAEERRHNQAIQLGNNWPKWVDGDSYVFTRCYRDSRCLVMLNKGKAAQAGEPGAARWRAHLPAHRRDASSPGGTRHGGPAGAIGPRLRHPRQARGRAGGNPPADQWCADPARRLAVIGDCPELGRWDLREAYHLDCINSNTWFGEIPFNESAGSAVGYKYVIFPGR